MSPQRYRHIQTDIETYRNRQTHQEQSSHWMHVTQSYRHIQTDIETYRDRQTHQEQSSHWMHVTQSYRHIQTHTDRHGDIQKQTDTSGTKLSLDACHTELQTHTDRQTYTVSGKKVTPYIRLRNSNEKHRISTKFSTQTMQHLLANKQPSRSPWNPSRQTIIAVSLVRSSGVDIQGEYGVYTPPVRKIHNFLCTWFLSYLGLCLKPAHARSHAILIE